MCCINTFSITLVLLVMATSQPFVTALALEYGDMCSEGQQDQCDRRAGLICRDSKCQCFDDTRMAYSSKICRTFTNGNCTAVYGDGERVRLPCLDDKASCHYDEGTCLCSQETVESPWYEVNIDVRCFEFRVAKPVDVRCNITENLLCPASSGLQCVNGYCQCPFPRKQHLSWNLVNHVVQRKCATGPNIVNACDPASEASNPICDPNSYCRNDGMCHCKTGYTSSYTIPPRCVFDIHNDQNCIEGNERFMCNEGAGLICSDNKCICEPGSVYDELKSACVGVEGDPCYLQGHSGRCSNGTECVVVDPVKNPAVGTCKLVPPSK